jgi:hypothetical protein
LLAILSPGLSEHAAAHACDARTVIRPMFYTQSCHACSACCPNVTLTLGC